MARIFISYSRTDETFAYQLAQALQEAGGDVWIDQHDIPAGKNWSSAIQQGLDSADMMLIILSPDSMESVNVTNEWQYFLDHNKTIIPVLWRPTKVHFQLHRLQYVDFHAQPFADAFNELLIEFANRSGEVSRIAPIQSTHMQTLTPGQLQPVPTSSKRKPRKGGRSVLGMLGIAAFIALPVFGIGAFGANWLMNQNVVEIPTVTATMATASPAPTTPVPSHTPDNTASHTPTATEDTFQPVPGYAICPGDFSGYMPPRIDTGTHNARIKATGGDNRMRSAPYATAELIGMLSEGLLLDEVISGPACTEGYVWWLVRSEDMIGWTAESSFVASDYFVEPFPSLTPTPTSGGSIIVTLDFQAIPMITLDADSSRFTIGTPMFVQTQSP